MADYQNLEKRVQKDRKQEAKFAARNIILKILPLLDILEKISTQIKDESIMLLIKKFRDIDVLDLAFTVRFETKLNIVRDVLNLRRAPDFKYSSDVLEQFDVWCVVGWFIGDGIVNVVERSRAKGDRELRIGLSIGGVKDNSKLIEIANYLGKVLGDSVKVDFEENRIYFIKDAKINLLKHTYKLFVNLPKYLWPRKIRKLMSILTSSRYYSWLKHEVELNQQLTIEEAIKLLVKHMRIKFRGNCPYVYIYGLKSSKTLRKAYELIRSYLGITKGLESIRNRTLELSGDNARKLINLVNKYIDLNLSIS